MNVVELYFAPGPSMRDLAEMIGSALGSRPPRERQGLNRGGKYYHLSVFGFEMELLSNRGEVAIPERAAWPYYMLFYSEVSPISERELWFFAEHAASLIKSKGIDVEVDCLS